MLAAATPDPGAAELPVPAVGVNSLGPEDLAGGGGHLQIRPRAGAGAGWGEWDRIAARESRRPSRTLGRRKIQKMSKRGI